jgi:hypothetical protein
MVANCGSLAPAQKCGWSSPSAFSVKAQWCLLAARMNPLESLAATANEPVLSFHPAMLLVMW